MGGGGGGKSGGLSSSGPSPEQRETQKFFLESVTKPLAGAYVPQVLEAIQTGGTNAQIPSIQRAVEQSKAAMSRALRTTDESLSRGGQRDTPYAELVKALAAQSGEQATGKIPGDFAQMLASLAPNMLQGGGQIAVSGPATAKSTTAPDKSFLSGIGQGLGQLGAAAIT